MRSPWKVGLVLWGMGLLISSSMPAYELSGRDWSYMTNPMGEDWNVCPTGIPGSGVQRTQDGAFEWNYSEFTFTFGADVCLSGGIYPVLNGVNQVDFGSFSSSLTLAETVSWFLVSMPENTIECDMRFNNAKAWYTGTDTPSSTQYDWWSVAAHEMGHCLGLAHEDDIMNPKPLMYPTLAAGEVLRDLTADDIAGRNATYNAPGLNSPNLTPYQPPGWSDKIVVSTTAGTNIDSSSLTPTNTLYVDWAVVNNGSGVTTAIFYTDLYVDGGFKDRWSTSPPLYPLPVDYAYVLDYSIGTLSVGTHTIKIVPDSTGAIAESNEGDNEYTKTITVTTSGVLENPQTGSFQSGIGVVSGWVCSASRIDIVFDNAAPFQAAYGTSREDTRSVCGDANNGFGMLFNWNLLGNGSHMVRVLADGVEFSRATFTVTTLGTEFLRGASGRYTIPNFPQAGRNVIIRWQESSQNFVIEGVQ